MSAAPRCDLVLLSWNHLEETQPCLASLFETVDVPARLLIVDNGSEPSVRKFLRSVRPSRMIQEVRLLQHETNEGFSRGMNRGLRESSAPYVCLLNNDLRFTAGWLREMLDIAERFPDAGLINPQSSTFGCRPAPGVTLAAHAAELFKRFQGRVSEIGMGIGFCLMVRREAFERVGGFSEEVNTIFFEDEDLSMRVQAAGYRCLVAEGAYVYHAEHQTVRAMPERETLFTANQRWCNDRWGRRLRIAWPHFEPLPLGSEALHRWLETLVRWARRRTHVYAYGAFPALPSDAVFGSVGLVAHSDVHLNRIPSTLPTLAAAGMVLRRRKKPFDIIVAPDDRWGCLMARLRWCHRADVVAAVDDAQLETQWQSRSRSPS